MREKLADGAAPASRSTAERALRALKEVFPQIECVNEGEAGEKRWRLAQGNLAGLAAVTADELADLDHAEALCRANGLASQAGSLSALGAKLRAVMTSPARTESDLEALAMAEGIAHRPGPRPLIDPAHVAALREAIKAMRQVELLYVSRASGKTSRQRLSPLGILYGNRAYLLAFNHNPEVEAIRSFAVSNIREVTPLADRAHSPPEFIDLKTYTRDWFGVFEEKPFDVVLEFTAQAAADARAFLFHPSQSFRDLDKGRLEVRFRAGGLDEMAWHLFTWGDAVRVKKPKRLRDRLRC